MNKLCGIEPKHFDWINDFIIESNQEIITASSDGTCRKFYGNIHDGYHSNKIIQNHTDKIWRITKINSYYVSIGWDGYVKIFGEKNICSLKVHHSVAMCVETDNEYIYTAGWDMKLIKTKFLDNNLTIEKTVIIPGNEPPISILLIDNHVLIGSKEGKVYLYTNELELVKIFEFHKSFIWRMVSISRIKSINLFVTFSYDKRIALCLFNNGNISVLKYFEHSHFMGGGIIELENQLIIAGGTLMGEIILWNLDRDFILNDGETYNSNLKKVEIKPYYNKKIHDKAVLTVKQYNNNMITSSRDRSIKIFDITKEPHLLHSIEGGKLTPTCSESDNNGIITGFHEKFAQYCDIHDEKVVNTVKIDSEFSAISLSAISSVALSKEYVFIGSANRILIIFSRKHKKIVKRIKLVDNPIFMKKTDKSLIIVFRKGIISKLKFENITDQINDVDILQNIGKIDFRAMNVDINENKLIVSGNECTVEFEIK